jgi:hypothetical protein
MKTFTMLMLFVFVAIAAAFGSDLGTITNLQTMTGVKFQAQDANGHTVTSFNGITLTSDQASAVRITNVQATADLPAGSTFTADIQGLAPSNGPVTITAKGQQGNFQPTFTTTFTITVVLDPSLPGPPVAWVATAGAVAPTP